jgi:hypothetical protein
MSQPPAIDQLASALTSLLSQAADDAANQAAAAPDRVNQMLGDALVGAEKEVELAEAQLQQLKQAAQHPDWLGLITFALVRLVELAGDPRLTVIAYQPGGGLGKALGVRYLLPVPGGTDARLVLAFATTDGGSAGIAISATGSPALDLDAGPVHIHASVPGSGDWLIPFGGGIPAPAGLATVDLAAQLRDPMVQQSQDGLTLGVGVPKLAASLSAGGGGGPTWSMKLSLEGAGGPSIAGVRAVVDLSSFIGPDLSRIIALTPLDERYSPSVSLATGTAPSVDLGHSGL